MFGCDSHVGSTHGNLSDKKAEHIPYSERCLDAFSFSTCGWFLLLLRLGAQTRASGGLRSDSGRSSSHQLLHQLLLLFRRLDHPVSIDLCLDFTWLPRWPRPFILEGDEYLTLEFGADLILDLSLLHRRSSGDGRHPVAAKWWSQLKDGLPRESLTTFKVSLISFLDAAAGDDGLRSLLGQFLVQLAVRYETMMGHLLSTPSKKDSSCSVSAVWSDDVSGGFDWEPKLPLYQLSGIQATELDAICSFAIDKAACTHSFFSGGRAEQSDGSERQFHPSDAHGEAAASSSHHVVLARSNDFKN